MKNNHNPLAGIALIVACLPLWQGCSDSKSTTAGKSAEQQDNANSGFQPSISQEQNSAPQQTVAVFLDCLRRGDEATANSKLTTKAREELKKTNYIVQPLGTPEGRFEIGRLGYPYADKSVALVECQWHEPATATSPTLVMEIVCEVYQESTEWRIAGMAVTMQGDTDTLVIDFEDGAALQRMLDIANGQVPQQPVNQVAQPGQQTSQINGNALPPLPTYPAAASSQTAQPPNFGPVLR